MSDYTPANLDTGQYGHPIGFTPNADISLGLGGEDINWQNSPSISSQQDNDSALYDGYGDYTTPYSTADLYIARRHISMHCFFYTQRDEYDAYWVVGRQDNPEATVEGNQYEFSQELMSFHTDNQNKGIPTMQIQLFGYRDWEQILKPNDYVAIQVWETYPDMPNYIYHNSDQDTNTLGNDYYDGIRRRTLMVGLISNIQMNIDGQSLGYTYTITCQGMQKVLANITLGLPKTAQWNDVNLLYDINGESSPWNEQFPTNGGGESSSSNSNNSSSGGSYGLSGVAGQMASYWSGKGMSKIQCGAIIGCAKAESGLNLSASNGSHFGLYQSTNSAALGASVQKQGDLLDSTFPGRVPSFKKDSSGESDVATVAKTWQDDVERSEEDLSTHQEDAEEIYHEMK